MKEIVGLMFVLIMTMNIGLIFAKAKYSLRMKASLQAQSTTDDLFHLLTSFLYYSINNGDYKKSFEESMEEQFPGYVEEYLPALKRHTKRLRDLLNKAAVSDFSDDRYTKMNLTKEYVTSKKFPILESTMALADKYERLKTALAVCQLLAALDVIAFMFTP